jgi:hypothetical protein
MYVAKITRSKIILVASVFEKYWSEEMLSNSVTLIGRKKFLLRFSAYKWVNAEISRSLFRKKQLEIIDE